MQILTDELRKIIPSFYSSEDVVKIVEFEGNMDGNDLVLEGKCENCSGKVVRLIEG